MRLGSFVLGLILLSFSWNSRAIVDCEGLGRQIQAMEKAQNTILSSMANKNSSMAETLDSFADDFAKRGRALKKGDVVSLQKTAIAFRQHEKREKELIGKFERQSQELLKKAVQCMSKNETLVRETSL